MKNLRELDLSGSNFVGQLPQCLGHLNKLRVLDLSSNELSGNIPSSFSGLKSLEYLSLSDNNFKCLFSLSPLANLTKVKVFKLWSISDIVQVDTESTWLPKCSTNLKVEADSKILIDCIRKGSLIPEIYSIVADIGCIASEFNYVSFVWISSYQNRSADELAKQSLVVTEAFMTSLPYLN